MTMKTILVIVAILVMTLIETSSKSQLQLRSDSTITQTEKHSLAEPLVDSFLRVSIKADSIKVKAKRDLITLSEQQIQIVQQNLLIEQLSSKN